MIPKHEAAVGSVDQHLNGVDDVLGHWTGASREGRIRFADPFLIHSTYETSYTRTSIASECRV